MRAEPFHRIVLAALVAASFAALAPRSSAQERGTGPLARPAGATAPATPAHDSPESRPLPVRKRDPAAAGGDARGAAGGLTSWTTSLGGLAVVAALAVVASWMLKKMQPAGNEPLPAEVLESLGRAPLAGGQQMHLVRCGAKLLLLSVTSNGAQTLSEISDPAEVARLTELCRPRVAARKEASHA
jgi:flagellar protein FliO/FliZ